MATAPKQPSKSFPKHKKSKTLKNYTNPTTQSSTPVNHTSNSSSPTVNQSTSSSKSSSASSGYYVGNANTMKFHQASCRYVSQMDPANKIFFNSREQAIAAGYVPCNVCNP